MKDADIAWCTHQLQGITRQDDMTDLALLIATMSSRAEIQEFLTDLLGEQKVKSGKIQGFISSCLERFVARDHEVAYRKDKNQDKPTPAAKKKSGLSKNLLNLNFTRFKERTKM